MLPHTVSKKSSVVNPLKLAAKATWHCPCSRWTSLSGRPAEVRGRAQAQAHRHRHTDSVVASCLAGRDQTRAAAHALVQPPGLLQRPFQEATGEGAVEAVPT